MVITSDNYPIEIILRPFKELSLNGILNGFGHNDIIDEEGPPAPTNTPNPENGGGNTPNPENGGGNTPEPENGRGNTPEPVNGEGSSQNSNPNNGEGSSQNS